MPAPPLPLPLPSLSSMSSRAVPYLNPSVPQHAPLPVSLISVGKEVGVVAEEKVDGSSERDEQKSIARAVRTLTVG